MVRSRMMARMVLLVTRIASAHPQQAKHLRFRLVCVGHGQLGDGVSPCNSCIQVRLSKSARLQHSQQTLDGRACRTACAKCESCEHGQGPCSLLADLHRRVDVATAIAARVAQLRVGAAAGLHSTLLARLGLHCAQTALRFACGSRSLSQVSRTSVKRPKSRISMFHEHTLFLTACRMTFWRHRPRLGEGKSCILTGKRSAASMRLLWYRNLKCCELLLTWGHEHSVSGAAVTACRMPPLCQCWTSRTTVCAPTRPSSMTSRCDGRACSCTVRRCGLCFRIFCRACRTWWRVRMSRAGTLLQHDRGSLAQTSCVEAAQPADHCAGRNCCAGCHEAHLPRR